MPTPSRTEAESAFISRYMGSGEAKKSFPDAKQRAAVAYSVYKNRKKKRK